MLIGPMLAAQMQQPHRAVAGKVTFGDLQFESHQLFYSLVTTFISATAGLTPVFDQANHETFLEGIGGEYEGRIVGKVRWDLRRTVAEVRGGAIDANSAVTLLCCMLANSAWELAKLRVTERQQLNLPETQVLRHLRNAASHGNVWHFDSGNPSKPAHWRGLILDHSLKGDLNPRHGKQCFGADLLPADLLHLLFDLQHYLPFK